MKKILNLVMVVLLGFILVGCGASEGDGEVRAFEISVYNAEDIQLYSEEISTTEETLFDALLESDQIEIDYESGEFGNFITTINDEEAASGYFWLLIINGEDAMVGADGHTIEDGDQIEFRLANY